MASRRCWIWFARWGHKNHILVVTVIYEQGSVTQVTLRVPPLSGKVNQRDLVRTVGTLRLMHIGSNLKPIEAGILMMLMMTFPIHTGSHMLDAVAVAV